MTRYVGIVGYPLGHSVSPIFQQAALDHYSLDIRYQAWETPKDALASLITALKHPGCLGANVTVPYKEAVLPLIDDMDEIAALVGAVNVIVNQDGMLIGYNTDTSGFLQGLTQAGFDPLGKRALLLGAGGAAHAIGLALGQQGLLELIVANRNPERAHLLLNRIGPLVPEGKALSLAPRSLSREIGKCDLIVNCTSLGMSGGPGNNQSPLPSHLIPPTALVCDLVYNPPLTPLLGYAQDRGARTLGGLPMLIYQGAAAFELWTGKQAPLKIMWDAAERSLGRPTGPLDGTIGSVTYSEDRPKI